MRSYGNLTFLKEIYASKFEYMADNETEDTDQNVFGWRYYDDFYVS